MYNDLKADNPLDIAVQKARQFVPTHVANQAGERVELYKLRGRIGEELAQQEIGGFNLNDVTGKSNFANYDILSDEFISSVKVKGLTEQGEPRYGDYNKYFKDIVNPKSSSNQQAAKDMLHAKSINPQSIQNMPFEMVEANNPEEMAHAMANKSILQIPYDQVASTRENIHQRIVKSPGDYGLNESQNLDSLEIDAKQLVNKHIQPISEGQYSSHEIGQAASNVKVGHTMEQAESEDYYYGYNQ